MFEKNELFIGASMELYNSSMVQGTTSRTVLRLEISVIVDGKNGRFMANLKIPWGELSGNARVSRVSD